MTLVALATVGGIGIGMLEVYLGHRIWPLTLSLSLFLALLASLARPWIWQPLEDLLDAWHRCRTCHPLRSGSSHDAVSDADSHAAQRILLESLRLLPITRQDEIGRIARAFYQLSLDALRKSYESRHLRRTLDHRIAQETRRATARLQKLAMRDPLTDVGNRRFLHQSLEPLAQSVLLSHRTLTAVMVDLDHFKTVNDRFGHAAGDELLVALAGLLRASIRQDDLVVRMGGDEFLLLLPDCPPQRVTALCRHIQSLFRQYARLRFRNVALNLSFGLALLPSPQVTRSDELLRRADENLYQAKRAGRGQIVGP